MNVLNYMVNLQKYMFEKYAVPQNKSEKEAFIAKLAKIGVTLRSYVTSLDQDEKIKRFVVNCM